MITRITTFTKWTEAITTAIIGVLSGYYYSILIQDSNQIILWLFVTITLVLMSEKIITLAICYLINNYQPIRKRLLGNDFIEGHWIDFTQNPTDETADDALALLTITIKDMEYIVNGQVYDSNYNFLGCFTSKMATYQNYRLQYYYEGHNVQSTEANIHGYAEFNFVPSEKYPKRFAGRLIDSKNSDKIKLAGTKIDKSYLEKYDIDSPAGVKKLFELYKRENNLAEQAADCTHMTYQSFATPSAFAKAAGASSDIRFSL